MVGTYSSCVEIVTHTFGMWRLLINCQLSIVRSALPLGSSKNCQFETHQVVIAAGSHLFPFRTEKLSPPAPMVLQCNAGE